MMLDREIMETCVFSCSHKSTTATIVKKCVGFGELFFAVLLFGGLCVAVCLCSPVY